MLRLNLGRGLHGHSDDRVAKGLRVIACTKFRERNVPSTSLDDAAVAPIWLHMSQI